MVTPNRASFMGFALEKTDPPTEVVGPDCEAWIAGQYAILVSDKDVYAGERWRHVSLSLPNRTPGYDAILELRTTFFPPNAEVLQIFPPAEEHRSYHPHCLHLWWRKDGPRVGHEQMQMAVAP